MADKRLPAYLNVLEGRGRLHHVKKDEAGIDATRKHKFPARSIPPQEDLHRVDAHKSLKTCFSFSLVVRVTPPDGLLGTGLSTTAFTLRALGF